ncbi:ATPase-activating ribosome biosynthesis protein, partial [Peltigera leucophlebia]|nr:ATPase-activating ribosome biosynthesis protein [Peltigera leucophlebia]
MIVDSTLTFAARRNIPVRYNRDLVSTTLKAMERVAEIRAKRERVFYKNRMKGNKQREKDANRKLVAENEHLLPRVRGSELKRRREEEQEGMEVEVEVEEDVVVVAEDEEEEKVEVKKKKGILKGKRKQRLLVSGGTENEDME